MHKTAENVGCELNEAGNADKIENHISSDNDTTLLDNRTSSNVTGSEEVNIEKNNDKADIIVKYSEKTYLTIHH